MESDTSVPVQLRSICNILEHPNGHKFLSLLGNLDGKRISEMCSRYLNDFNDNNDASPELTINSPNNDNNNVITRKRAASTNIADDLDVESIVESLICAVTEDEKRQLLERQKELGAQISDTGKKSSSGFREKALVEEKIMVKKRLRTMEEAEEVQVCLDVINLEPDKPFKLPPLSLPPPPAPLKFELFTPEKMTPKKTMLAEQIIERPIFEDALMEPLPMSPADNLQTLEVFDNNTFRDLTPPPDDTFHLLYNTYLAQPGISIRPDDLQLPTSTAYDVATQFRGTLNENMGSSSSGSFCARSTTSTFSDNSYDGNPPSVVSTPFTPVPQYLASDPLEKIGTRIEKDAFQCCHCERIFKTRAKLLIHSATAHKVGTILQCKDCERIYSTEITFKKHKCAPKNRRYN